MVPLTYVSPTTKILCDHIRRLVSEPAGDEEFTRAKNQLKSMVFMNLEQRSVYCEEIGQQFLSFNHIMEAMKDALQYPIAFSVFGKDVRKELNTLPPVDGIRSYLEMPYKWCVCCEW